MRVSINIDADTLNDTAPSDGFIEPTRIQYYRSNTPYNGGVETPTLVAGSQIKIRDVPITLSGTNLASLITDINAKTRLHKVIASNNTGLELIMSPGHEMHLPTMLDVTGDTVELTGFDDPTIGAVPDYPNLNTTLAKVRGNIRWELLLTNLGLTGNINVDLIEVEGGAINSDPSEITVYLTVDEQYYNYDFSNELVFGEDALRIASAKSLMLSKIKTETFFDITDADPPNEKIFGQVIRRVEAGPLADDENTALGAVTVNILN